MKTHENAFTIAQAAVDLWNALAWAQNNPAHESDLEALTATPDQNDVD